MWEAVKEVLVALCGSKKAMATAATMLASLLVMVLGERIGLSQEQAAEWSTKAVAALSAYVLGQGVADHGKEAAKGKPSHEPEPKEG